MNILITGVSSGLGYELAKKFIANGDNVYGTSRRSTDLNIEHLKCDFNDLFNLALQFDNFVTDIPEFDIIILNAGMLGELEVGSNLQIHQFEEIFKTNVLANKVILDTLMHKNIKMQQVIGISSGAALKSYHGWSLYCTTKAAFKQLLSCYADETPDIHFTSLAPGIIKTSMQDYIYNVNESKIPSVKKFKQMYGNMDSAEVVAKKIFDYIPNLLELNSGDYFDLRNVE